MRVALLILTLMLASATADAAKIYKWFDDRGNAIYSDQPHPGAEEIDVQTEPAGIVPVPEQKQRQRRSPAPERVTYQALAFTSPANEETIWDNAGTVKLALQAQPPLAGGDGHTIRLTLDGVALPTGYQSTEIVLTAVPRGNHVVQAAVVDANGSTLIRSDPLTFYLKESSLDAPAGPGNYPPVYPPQPYPPVYPPGPYPPVYPKQGQPKPG